MQKNKFILLMNFFESQTMLTSKPSEKNLLHLIDDGEKKKKTPLGPALSMVV